MDEQKIKQEIDRITDWNADVYVFSATENIAYATLYDWGCGRDFLIEERDGVMFLIATKCTEDDTDNWEIVNKELTQWIDELIHLVD